MSTSTPNQTITIRVPRGVHEEVRRIAKRDAETQASVFRQLIKVGLRSERNGDAKSERA